MGSMILPNRLIRQPQQLLPIDWSNPLSKGLVGFWLPIGSGFVSLVPGVRSALVAPSATSGASTKGRTIGRASGNGIVASIPRDSRWQPTSAITLIGEGMTVNTGSGGANYWMGNEDSGGGFGFYGSADATVHPYLKVGGSFADRSSGIALGAWAQLGFTFDGSTFYTVANGTRSNSQAISGSITNAASDLALCAINGAASSSGNGSFVYLAIWNRALSMSELASFYANPWQIIKSPVQRLSVSPNTPNANILTTSPGSYSIIGNAAALLTSRKLTAAAGSYAITGIAANLRTTRRITAVTGTYSITGIPANLIKGTAPKVMQVQSGAYTLTGQSASLRMTRRMPAATGSYSITGFATGLPQDYSGFKATVQYHYMSRSKLTLVRFAT